MCLSFDKEEFNFTPCLYSLFPLLFVLLLQQREKIAKRRRIEENIRTCKDMRGREDSSLFRAGAFFFVRKVVEECYLIAFSMFINKRSDKIRTRVDYHNFEQGFFNFNFS